MTQHKFLKNCFYLLLLGLTSFSYGKDISILFLGTDRTYSAHNDSVAFNITSVANELENILINDPAIENVQVDFDPIDIIHRYNGTLFTYRYYAEGNRAKNSAGETYWQDYPSDRDDNHLPLLRGETKTYDYVVILDNPAIMETFPGKYMEGVKAVTEEIAKSGAKPILLMSWPGHSSSSTVEHYKEVVYRTGDALNIQVAPAALAWESEDNTHHNGVHPSIKGAYIAASSIYSTIYDESASNSAYNSTNHSLANSVEAIIDANKDTKYSGRFSWDDNPEEILFFQERFWSINWSAKSTETNFFNELVDVMEGDYFMINSDGPDDYNIPRGTTHTRDANDFGKGKLSYFYERSGSEKYFFNRVAYDTYLDTFTRPFARMSLERGQSRHLPMALLWMEHTKDFPSAEFMGSHGHIGIDTIKTTTAYRLTQLTGRCPLPPKPDPLTDHWNALRVGYETAWRYGTLQDRAPGFKSLPSHRERITVDPLTSEIMTSYFVLPPQENVTVTITTSQPWATISPQTIVFTPEDYDQVRNITVSVAENAPRGAAFNVIYQTSSDDNICDGLRETWEYTVNKVPVAESQSVITQANRKALIVIKGTDADLMQSISYEISQTPTNGEIAVEGSNVIYTPNENFVGKDSFSFTVNDGLTVSLQEATVDIDVLGGALHNYNLIFNPKATFKPLNENGWNGSWVSNDEDQFKAPTTTKGETYETYQDVDVSGFSDYIDAGVQTFKIDFESLVTSGDIGSFHMEYRNSIGEVLGVYDSGDLSTGNDRWSSSSFTVLVPANTVVIRIILRSLFVTNYRGNSCHFDDLSLVALKPANSAPVAVDPPTISIAMDVPSTIPLVGADLDGDELTYSIVTDPVNGVISAWDGLMPIYTPNAGFLGTDSFTFKANDGENDSENIATANIIVRPNEAPSIIFNTPKTDHVYMAQTNGLIVDASVIDDGAPLDPGHLTFQWSQVSGPVTATFESPDSEDTAINWGDFNNGLYVFRLTASDGSLSSFKDITVTVGNYDPPTNLAPQMLVIEDFSGTTGTPITIKATDSSDNKPVDPGITTTEWLLLSGPGSANFADSSALTTTVTFDLPGTYTLRITGDDGEVKAYRDITVEVEERVLSPYEQWSGGSELLHDDNADGVDNGIAWVLGATDPSTNIIHMLPSADTKTDTDYIIYSYRRSDEAHEAQGTTIAAQYTNNISGWTTALHDGDNVIIDETDDFYTSGVDRVTVKLKRQMFDQPQVFIRLQVNQ